MGKGKTKVILGVIFGILIVAAIIGMFIYLPGPEGQASTQTQCTGGQVLSISSAVKTFSGELGKDVIRVVFSTLPTSECIDIQWNEADLESKLKQSGVNFDVQKTSIGDIILTESKKSYLINERSTEKLRKIGLVSVDTGLTAAVCTNSKCTGKGYATTFASVIVQGERGTGSVDCYCAYDDEKGVNAEIASSEGYVWNTKIKIDGEGETDLYRRSPSEQKLSDRIGSRVFIKWSGNLVSNDNLGSINRDAFKPYSDNQYRLIEKGTYTTLNSQYQTARNALLNCDTTFASACNTQVVSARGFNGNFDSKTANGLSTWTVSEPLVDAARTSIVSNHLNVGLKSPIVYPQFTLDIEASKIGIFVSTGKPEASCPASVNDLISGQQKAATFSIKNVGSGSGSFDYSLVCNKGSQNLQPSPPKSIGAGSSLAITGTVGLTVPSEGSETSSCTFTARELNTLQESSCSFSYTATHQSQCTANSKTCEAGNTEMWMCKADGSYEKTQCEFGCEAFEDTVRCRLQAKEICDDEIDNDGNGLIDENDLQCKESGSCGAWIKLPEVLGGATILPNLWCMLNNFLAGFKVVFAMVLGLIAAIVSGVIFRTEQNKNHIGGPGWLALVVGLIVGLGIGATAFFFFWLSLVGLVIIILVKVFV